MSDSNKRRQEKRQRAAMQTLAAAKKLGGTPLHAPEDDLITLQIRVGHRIAGVRRSPRGWKVYYPLFEQGVEPEETVCRRLKDAQVLLHSFRESLKSGFKENAA